MTGWPMGLVRSGLARVPGSHAVRSFWPSRRVRRLLDAGWLAVAAGALAVLVLLAVRNPGVLAAADRGIPDLLSGLPRAVASAVNVVFSVGVLGVLLAVAVDALRWRRFALTAAVLGGVVGAVAGFAVALLVDVTAGGATMRLLTGTPGETVGLPFTVAVAIVVGSDLRRRGWLGVARLALGGAVVCALLLGSVTAGGAAYAVLVGATAGLAVRVAAGVVPARPSDEVVRSVLARAGWDLAVLDPVEEGAGRIRYTGAGSGEADLRITVVDPDRRGLPLARRAWRVVRLRTSAVGRPALSLRGQVERQALTAGLAHAAGVAGPRVLALLAAGPALVLVERPLAGTPLAGTPLAAAETAAAFEALRRLHDAGLAHGAITAQGVVVSADGRAGFVEFQAAQPAATELQRELDVVALLVAVASVLGVDMAVAGLRAGYPTGAPAQARLAALLQPLALPRPARRAVRGTTVLGDLRTALAGSTAAGSVAAPPRLERLRARTVVMVAGATLAAHVLATQLSSVGIASALRSARPTWLLVAVFGSATTYLGAALVTRAFVPSALPLARTALVQLASSFLALVTPPAVGHVGLTIRYLQRSGVSTALATASVAVKEVFTVVVTVAGLLVCAWLSGVSAARLSLLPSGSVLTVLIVAGAAIAVVAIVPPTRRLLLRRVQPMLRRIVPQLVAAVSQPRRVAAGLLGVLVLNGGNVLALHASLRAFSATLAIPALVVVFLAASAIGSAAPTPGGLGAVEAALVGGLTATGVAVAPALTAVLAFRAATFWLPAPLGWVAFVGLQRRGRI